MAQAKQRVTWLDIAKAITIFLVVFGHVLRGGTAQKIVFSFHVATFFLLSGMTCKTDNLKARIKNDFLRIMVPYYSFSILSIIIFRFLGDFAASRFSLDVDTSLWHNLVGIQSAPLVSAMPVYHENAILCAVQIMQGKPATGFSLQSSPCRTFCHIQPFHRNRPAVQLICCSKNAGVFLPRSDHFLPFDPDQAQMPGDAFRHPVVIGHQRDRCRFAAHRLRQRLFPKLSDVFSNSPYGQFGCLFYINRFVQQPGF